MQELGAKQYFNQLFDSPDNFPQAYSHYRLQRKATWSSGEPAHCRKYLHLKFAFHSQTCHHSLPSPKSIFWAETWFFKRWSAKDSL